MSEDIDVGDRVLMAKKQDGFFTEVPGTVVPKEGKAPGVICENSQYLLVKFDREALEDFDYYYEVSCPLHNGDLGLGINRAKGRHWYVLRPHLKRAPHQLELFGGQP